MPESVAHRIFVGNKSKGLDDNEGFLLTPPFTFDRTDITFDSVVRTFDETI